MKRAHLFGSAAPVVLLAALALPAHAQSTGASQSGTGQTTGGAAGVSSGQASAPRVLQGVEEVVVTAQRREEQLQNVPIAVTTVSEATLERQQIGNIQALDRIVPNIVMNPNTGTSSASKIFLRGVGEDESFFTADTPVGIYVDDVYIARQTGSMFDLFDVERMEVLRGPQGTLYGRNTSAGAVKLVSRKPSLSEQTFQADLTVGSYNMVGARASGNVPLGDRAAVQVAAMLRERDGYTRNLVTGKRVNDQDVRGGRISFLGQLSDNLSVLVVGDVVQERSTPGYPVPLVINRVGTVAVPTTDPATGGYFRTFSDIPDPENDLDQQGLSATLEYEVSPELTLKSISALRGMQNNLGLDADGTTESATVTPPLYRGKFHLYQEQDQWQFSQELQGTGNALDGKLNYIAGVFYFREYNDQKTQSVLGIPAINLFFNRANTAIADETLGTSSWAGFGSATYSVTDQLRLTAGLRWTEETKRFTNYTLLPATGQQQTVCLNPLRTGNLAAAPCSEAQLAAGGLTFANGSNFEASWSEWTPRFVADFQATEDILLYASAAKGFKGGTTSGRDTSGPRNFNRIIGDPETNWSYEAGVKADWADNRLRTNVAVFQNEYEGLQVGVTSPAGGFDRINAGDARIRGLEVEATAVPVEGLELFGSLGLLDGKYKSFTAPLATCAGFTSNQQFLDLDLKQTPDWSYRVGFTYAADLGTGGVVTVGGDYAAKDKHYNNLCNSEAIAVRDYEFVNAQVSWESAGGNWLVTGAVKNLTNEKVFNGGFDFAGSLGFVSAYLYPPRMYTVSLRYRM
ncbi:MAG TPA: TonB-dependent receptor [Azospirillaceae bacterium]|nr:TonB-dependent receptor [Azospirillaceae bacterium]